jgi:hypothetical protein
MSPLRRKSAASNGRQRVRPTVEPAKPEGRFAYSSRRSETELNTGRQAKRAGTLRTALGFWLQRLGMLILLLAVVASATNALTLSTYPKVLPLTQGKSNDFLRDARVYEDAAAKLLARSVWNRNKITVSSDRVVKDLVGQFPELSGASLTVPLLAHRPLIYIEPAKPVISLEARNGAFVVADTGKALLRGNTAKDLARYQLTPVKDQSGLKLLVGRQALSAANVRFIQTVIRQLSARHFLIDSMTLPPVASELDVKLKHHPYIVKFNLHSDKAKQQAGTFLATIAYLTKHNTSPKQYVDVRVDGRAYYR